MMPEQTQIQTPDGQQSWLNMVKMPFALAIAFAFSGGCNKVYAHFCPVSAAMPENINDTFTIPNLARLTVADGSMITAMQLILRLFISQDNNISLTTKIKHFLAPLAAFSVSGIFSDLINSSEPDVYTQQLLRAINAISAGGLLDYINGSTMPPAMFIQMISILFMKQNGGDISSLIQEFLDGYVTNLDSDTAARVTGVLSDVIAQVVLPPAIGAATGLAAAATPAIASSMKQTAQKTYSVAYSIGNACCSFFSGGDTRESDLLLPGPGPSLSAPILQ